MQETPDAPDTGVYDDGVEVTVRTASQYSRTWHVPKTDEEGAIVYDDDGHPIPACGAVSRRSYFRLAPCHSVVSKTACSNCADGDDEISERNGKGSDNLTLARLAQRKDFDGAKSLSGNTSHSD